MSTQIEKITLLFIATILLITTACKDNNNPEPPPIEHKILGSWYRDGIGTGNTVILTFNSDFTADRTLKEISTEEIKSTDKGMFEMISENKVNVNFNDEFLTLTLRTDEEGDYLELFCGYFYRRMNVL